MWRTFEEAGTALRRDGFARYTVYSYCKLVADSERCVWVELAWNADHSYLFVEKVTTAGEGCEEDARWVLS